MKPITEADTLKACLEYLRLQGIFAWRNNTTGIYDPARKRFRAFHGLRGVSDILGVLPDGRFLAIECKGPYGKTTNDQQFFIDFVNDNGGLAIVVRSLRELDKQLEEAGYVTKS